MPAHCSSWGEEMAGDGPDPLELLPLPRAAEIAGLNRRTLLTAIRRGNLAATKFGRDWGVTRGELHRYLMARSRGTPAPLPPDYRAPRGLE